MMEVCGWGRCYPPPISIRLSFLLRTQVDRESTDEGAEGSEAGPVTVTRNGFDGKQMSTKGVKDY
jgi:hypothetical protein